MRTDRRFLAVLGLLTLIQVLVYYDHFAVALAFLFGLGLGLWLQSWTAAVYALASFAVAFVIAVAIGWTEGARVWEALFGGALAFLGGLIGGGIFDLMRRESSMGSPSHGTVTT